MTRLLRLALGATPTRPLAQGHASQINIEADPPSYYLSLSLSLSLPLSTALSISLPVCARGSCPPPPSTSRLLRTRASLLSLDPSKASPVCVSCARGGGDPPSVLTSNNRGTRDCESTPTRPPSCRRLTVLSGLELVLDPHKRFAASCCASIRVGM